MVVNNYLSEDFQIVHPHAGVNTIEEILLEKTYMIVQDEQHVFYGIITPYDLVKRPHKLVIDCLDKIEKVDTNDRLLDAYNKMMNTNRNVLPVFKEDIFHGVIKLTSIFEALSKKNEEILLKAEGEKKVAESLKIKFLENISHEIRTPLNGITGFTELVSALPEGQPPSKDLLQILISSSRQFLEIMDGIVEMSKIQTGNTVYTKTCWCSAQSVIDEMYYYFTVDRPELNRNNIEIIKDHAPCDAAFFSDKIKVKQVLSYIISNALKFTESGFVKIGYTVRSKEVIFIVQDTGPGIPKEKQEYIFIPFEKIESNKNFILPGVGLGLTIAKHFTNFLGGEIWFNTIEKVGTTFCIQFPLNELTELQRN